MVPTQSAGFSWETPDRGQGSGAGSGPRLTVLLVDDEPLVRNVEQHMLANAGFNVLAAASGEEAVQVFSREHESIDLVILDYTMPGLSGSEAWEELRTIDEGVNVVFCSGNCSDDEARQLIDQGARGYIPKPFLMSDFVPKIQQIAENL